MLLSIFKNLLFGKNELKKNLKIEGIVGIGLDGGDILQLDISQHKLLHKYKKYNSTNEISLTGKLWSHLAHVRAHLTG